MKTINVNTSSKNYDIFVGRGILSSCGEIIKNLGFKGKIMVVTDDCVEHLYLDIVKKSLANSGFEVFDFVLPNGEQHKNMESIMNIYCALQENGINRKDMIVALGGGVIGDMAGFAAATYLRGIKYVQIPTTLLAQVDSSIGGKTGIDLEFGKNLVGAFYQPEAVITDADTLKTLDAANIACGMAEIIKSAFIKDVTLLEKLELSVDLDADVEDFILRTMCIKKNIVEFDEFEKYERMLLNFGHTLGHAIEKHMNFQGITHGQAVAIGMCLITKNADVKQRLEDVLIKYNLKTTTEIPVDKLITAAFNDKKAVNGGINVVLVEQIGNAYIKRITFEEFYNIYG